MDKNKLFNDQEATLKKCLQRAKGGKTQPFPCIFSMGDKKGEPPMFVLDFDGSVKRDRFLSEVRKRKHKKFFIGTVCIQGSEAEIKKEEEKGGVIKIETVKPVLKQYKITKAKFVPQHSTAPSEAGAAPEK